MVSENGKITHDVYISNIKPGATEKDLLAFLKKGVDFPDDAIEKIIFRERSALIFFKDKGVAERVICLNGAPWNGDPSEEKRVRIEWAPPALPDRPPTSKPKMALPEPKPHRRKWLRAVLLGLAVVSFALLVFFLLSTLQQLKETKSLDQLKPKATETQRKLQQLDEQLKELKQLLDE